MPVTFRRTGLEKFIDVLYISILLWYALSGMMLAPFHGDEATIIYLSRDWFRITQDHDLSLILFRPTIDDPREHDMQEYRLQNGVISKYAIGMVASLVGLRFDNINDPWYWGANYKDNRALGHYPQPLMLLAARLSSTFMLMSSIAITFAIGKTLGKSLQLSHGNVRMLAYITAFVYTSLPTVLLNGRRAMFEGANLLAIAAVIWMGLLIARSIQQGQVSWWRWLCLGLACGFGVASKHTVLLTIALVFASLVLLTLVNAHRILNKVIAGLTIAAAISVVIFIALNPAWWSQPLQMPALVAQLRQNTLNAEVTYMGGYKSTADQLLAPIRFPFTEAQYFEGENSPWGRWIKTEINAYSRSGLAGIDWYSLGFITYALLFAGIVALVLAVARRRYVGGLLLVVAGFTAIILLVVIPLPWQRYYLPLALPWSILIAVGESSIWSFGRIHFVRSQN